MEKLPAATIPDPLIERYKQGVDRTLIRENLLLTHEERLMRLQQMLEFVAEVSAAGDNRGGRDHSPAPAPPANRVRSDEAAVVGSVKNSRGLRTPGDGL